MSEHLRFSPDILSRLGEELIPDIDQGIIELVKNAYDADATECHIAVNDLRSGSGSIAISDNGTGMTEADIRDGWLVIGRSAKRGQSLTKVFGRVPVGDKGLGRLAALRLGTEVSVVTRPVDEPGTQYTLKIDWNDFAQASVVEDVALEVKRNSTRKPPGTEISISRISAKIGRTTVNKLARSLLLLSNPFAEMDPPRERRSLAKDQKADPGFKADLLTDQYQDLQRKVSNSYFSDAEYRIRARLDGGGAADFEILDWKGDPVHRHVAEYAYDAPPFVFDLWVFILDNRSFSTRASTIGEVREWLNHVGGVHIYEEGIRVPPYGGPGDDWLGMNLRRARSPERRPSTNTSVGRVKLSNVGGILIQKTDRIGYIENSAFLELRRCCGDALDWAARVQLRERDKQRQAEKAAIQQRAKRATVQLDRVLKTVVSDTSRKKVDDAIASYVRETERETKTLREELQLYRSLATAGMTSAVFAHEIGRPLQLIDSSIAALQRMIPANKSSEAKRRIKRVGDAKKRLNSFVSIPLTLLEKGKRRSGRIDLNHCIANLVRLLAPILDYYEVRAEISLSKEYTLIYGSEALVDGITLNLVMNSIHAFQRNRSGEGDRLLKIGTSYDGYNVILSVEDNAGGIDGVDLADIWLPGITTVPDGTGFGLTIVRDSVDDLGGSVDAVALTDFGGAQFTISLPPMRGLL